MYRPSRIRSAARYYVSPPTLDALASCLRRLANHKGLVRSEISSPMLLRLLPPPRRKEGLADYDARLRKSIESAGLDSAKAIYILSMARHEIDIAHARLTD